MRLATIDVDVPGETLVKLNGAKMGVNYGSDKVRFPTPVPVGSKVRAGVELTAVDDIPLGVQVTAKVTVEIEGVQKPAMVAQTISVVVP